MNPASNRSHFRWIPILMGLAVAAVLGFVLLKNRDARPIPPPPTGRLSTNQSAVLAKAYQQLMAAPRSAGAWGQYGMTLRAFDFETEALACFREAAALDSANPRWAYFIARTLRGQDPEEAYQWLATAVQLCGNEPEAPRFHLARWCAEEGRWDEAVTHAEALLSSKPNYSPARLLLAQRALAAGDTNAAAQFAADCTGDTRTRKAAWALLSAIAQRSGDSAESRQLGARAAALPLDEPIHDAFEAEAAALRGDPRSLVDQVHPLLAARRLADAVPLLQQLTNDYPTHPDTWLVHGRYLLLQKDFSGAERSLRRHLEQDPTSTQGYFQLGMACLSSTNFSAAADAFRKATTLKPDFGPAWFNLGFALGRGRQFAESSAAFREAIRCNPEHIDSYFLLADIQMQSNNRAEAVRLIDEAEKLNAADPRVAAYRRRLGR